jgi:putative protease
MRELETIPNRGYSLAFHDGQLSHHAHNYEDTQTLSAWEYAGMIVEVTDDAFMVLVKNRIEMGDVLEFLPSKRRETLLLRIYEFNDVKRQKITTTEGINAGQQPIIRVPFAWFHEEDAAELATSFPPHTVIRKERPLTQDAWERLELDRISLNAELGKASEEAYQSQREELVEALAIHTKGVTLRTPRLGAEGCCGRGCNGCQHFWNDPKYARARELLRTKKQGKLLSSVEAKLVNAP